MKLETNEIQDVGILKKVIGSIGNKIDKIVTGSSIM